ncbi:MAG: DUF2341 domain-containing protein [Chloroflexota bacterium]|nr:DUF2341 domain-containing protein [Chloroflexota bacterium]
MRSVLRRVVTCLVAALIVVCVDGGGAFALSPVELPPSSISTFHHLFDSWVVTTQAQFEAGVPDGVDTSTSPGDVQLAACSIRAPVTIDNGGAALSDYQVRVAISYDGDMQPNFDDIRFTEADGTTELPYWREGYVAATSAVFWVRVPSVPAGTSTIYMHYGDPGALSGSDGAATFLFYDDMESWSGWTDYGLGSVVQDGARAYDGVSSAHKVSSNDPNGAYKPMGVSLGRDVVVEAWVNRNGAYTGGDIDRIGLVDDSGNGYGPLYNHANSGEQVGIDRRSGCSPTVLAGSGSLTDILDEWYMLRLSIASDGTLRASRVTQGGVEEGVVTASDSTYSSFTNVYIFGGHDYWVDQVVVRRHASPEPTASVGAEERTYCGADWYSGSWGYRAPVTIDNGGAALSDYQVRVAISYDGDMQPNFDDIRFTEADGTTELPYWREGYVAATSAVFWVRVPSVPAGTSTIYMHYGDPGALSGSDGAATFLFYDDMESWSGWTDYGLGSVVQDGARAYDGVSSAHKVSSNDPNGAYKPMGVSLGRDVVVEAWVNRNGAYTGGDIDRIGLVDDSGNGYGPLYNHANSGEQVGIDRRSGCSPTVLAGSGSLTDILDEWYMLRLSIASDGTLRASRVTQGGVEEGVVTASDSTYSSFTNVYIFGGHDYWVDQVVVRRHASPEPTASVGAEEGSALATIASVVFDTGQVDAAWDGLGWADTLPAGTGISFEVRASDIPFGATDASPAWQAASALPIAGRYQQWRATLTTSVAQETPVLHEVRSLYSW